MELWTCSRIPFESAAKQIWKQQLVRDLKEATTRLEWNGQALAGTYSSTQRLVSDTENTLFTNPGTRAFPANTAAIRWERDLSDPPPPPEPVAEVGYGIHYYRYERSPGFQLWEPDLLLARWSRVPRQLTDDGSARPMWLALRQALVRGEVSLPAGTVPEGTRYALRIKINAPTRGPRSAVAASEPLVDGALSALHAGAPRVDAMMIAEILAPRVGMAPEQLVELVRDRCALFPGSPFVLGGGYLQLSPCDDLCVAGEVSIISNPTIARVETSGELFSVLLKKTPTPAKAGLETAVLPDLPCP